MEGNKTVSYHDSAADDSLSRDTFSAPSFPTVSDYDGLEQNTDDHNTLETNLNVSSLLSS